MTKRLQAGEGEVKEQAVYLDDECVAHISAANEAESVAFVQRLQVILAPQDLG